MADRRGYGTCTVCLKRKRLLTDGRIGYHTVVDMDYTTKTCNGSYSISREAANAILEKERRRARNCNSSDDLCHRIAQENGVA